MGFIVAYMGIYGGGGTPSSGSLLLRMQEDGLFVELGVGI